MKTVEFLEAFKQLSAKEREAVRTELTKEAIPDEPCCPPVMKDKVKGMMKKMEASDDPMAMCMEMMRMCQDKMSSACGG